nr:glycosyltransferase [Mucilaginibacter sp. L294]
MSVVEISAIVVGRNEGSKLENCLRSLLFCNDIIYADLDSKDHSLAIAEKFNCRVYNYKKYGPSCEYTQADLISEAINDWVILLDPDEAVDVALQHDIIEALNRLSAMAHIGSIDVPWQFYFGKKRLNGTVWGYRNRKAIVVNKNRYEILPITHYGRRLRPGFENLSIKLTGKNVLHHYWMDDAKSFIAKHKKYLKDEGTDRYNLGQRISVAGISYNIFYEFLRCFVITKGYKDGFTGLFLSFFWTWYCFKSNVSLYSVMKKRNKEAIINNTNAIR